ncbi:hypothetical protein LTR56_027563 [Elasticomyces elasticus]|nr:hypothetical protein LTR56_027563 [Elasticomyces elasticus]KAK4897249.1 hypothetical protein LTR49_028025 [Elasticomyces elasticus]KAK5735326.1 hypothetical protein LTS12_026491 [Elasticomyces elasticus]
MPVPTPVSPSDASGLSLIVSQLQGLSMDPSAHTSASIDATLSSAPVPSSTSSNTMAYTSGIMIEYARANETSTGADVISDNAFVVGTINADVSTSPDYCDESQVVYEDRT